jgi:hypothetical protein
VTGSELSAARLFDWSSQTPLELERSGATIAAIRFAGIVFRRP